MAVSIFSVFDTVVDMVPISIRLLSGLGLHCHRGFLNISADEKSRDFCCDWRFKG